VEEAKVRYKSVCESNPEEKKASFLVGGVSAKKKKKQKLHLENINMEYHKHLHHKSAIS